MLCACSRVATRILQKYNLRNENCILIYIKTKRLRKIGLTKNKNMHNEVKINRGHRTLCSALRKQFPITIKYALCTMFT